MDPRWPTAQEYQHKQQHTQNQQPLYSSQAAGSASASAASSFPRISPASSSLTPSSGATSRAFAPSAAAAAADSAAATPSPYLTAEPHLARLLSDQHSLRLQLKDLEARLPSSATVPASSTAASTAHIDRYLESRVPPLLKQALLEVLRQRPAATEDTLEPVLLSASTSNLSLDSASLQTHDEDSSMAGRRHPPAADFAQAPVPPAAPSVPSFPPPASTAPSLGDMLGRLGQLHADRLRLQGNEYPSVSSYAALLVSKQIEQLKWEGTQLPPEEQQHFRTIFEQFEQASKQQHQQQARTQAPVAAVQSVAQLQQQYPTAAPSHWTPVSAAPQQLVPPSHFASSASTVSASVKSEPHSPFSSAASNASSYSSGVSVASQPKLSTYFAPYLRQPAAAAASASSVRGSIPPNHPLFVLEQCGFKPFDFSYRTSAVNHLKSLLRDRVKVHAAALTNEVWQYEPRYTITGAQEWRARIVFSSRPLPWSESSLEFQGSWTPWHVVKTQAMEEAASLAIAQLHVHRRFKNLFLRPLPPPDDPNPISAVRNYLRDRSLWKQRILEERSSISERMAMRCELWWGDALVGAGEGSDKVLAKTEASIAVLRRWHAAMQFIENSDAETLAAFDWLELPRP